MTASWEEPTIWVSVGYEGPEESWLVREEEESEKSPQRKSKQTPAEY